MKARSPRALGNGFLAAIALAFVACGARSGLLLPLDLSPAPISDAPDAGPDALLDDASDAAPDTADAPPDAPFDAPPPICNDAGVTYIYVITAQNGLWSYYPPANTFARIGTVSCPTGAVAETPYSMAVDRGGTAYSVFTSGDLFRIDTANAACEATTFVRGQLGFYTFGMGFSSDTNDPGETLFVAEGNFTGPSLGLATIDTKTLTLSFVGSFFPSIYRTELTGTSDGRLFGFSIDTPGPGSHLSEIDKTTAQLLSSTPLAVGENDDAFAYAFWGGSFYIFTSPGGGTSAVTRYDPTTKTLQQINTHPEAIVGAGVSTCAPH